MTSQYRIPSLQSSASLKTTVLSPKNVRRLVRNDIPQVQRLVNDNITHLLFGKVEADMDDMISLSFLSVGIEDDYGKLIGAMCISICPNIPALPPWEWDHWLYNMYGLDTVYHTNTLWVSLIVWDDWYDNLFFKPILQAIFKTHPYLDYLFTVFPPNCSEITSKLFHEHGTLILPKGCANLKNSQHLYLIERKNYRLHYKIRRAVEEDNDELLPLISQHTKCIEELYGPFYIAEILSSHQNDRQRQIIVAETDTGVVGVIILNSMINYKMLNEEFELATFNGLRKIHEHDDVQYKSSTNLSDTTTSQIEPIVLETPTMVDFRELSQKLVEYSEEEILQVVDSISDYSLVLTSSSMLIYQDDDEDDEIRKSQQKDRTSDYNSMEFDILPQVLSRYQLVREYEEKNVDINDPRIIYVELMDKLSSKSSDTSRKLPTFLGEENAFCLEVVAHHEDHEDCIMLLLECVYECFPERDYSILSLPSPVRPENWMMLFVRVVARNASTFPNELYVLNRHAILTHYHVEVVSRDHMHDIKELLLKVPSVGGSMLRFCEIFADVDSNSYSPFVLLSQYKVIGLAVLAEEFDMDYLETHYDFQEWLCLSKHKSGGIGIILSLVLSPIFQNLSQYFLAQLHKLSDFSTLFYKYSTEESKMNKERHIVNVINWLLPVRPLQMPDFDSDMLLEEEYPLANVVLRQENFALYVTTLTSCSMSKFAVNTKIVVIGGTSTAIAFVISLVCNSTNPNYLIRFNNITFIFKNDLFPKLPKKIIDLFLIQKNFLQLKYVNMMNLKAYVNTITGTLTKIDRKEKYIVLNEKHVLKYDLLFLMIGDKFQKPLKKYRMPFAENPDNMLLINNGIDAHRAINKLRFLKKKFTFASDTIVIYGHFLQVYTCIGGLLEFGIPANNICLVQPYPYIMSIDKTHRQNISAFNDPEVYEAVMQELVNKGIKIYTSHYFIDWNFDSETNLIKTLTFESKNFMLELECWAAFFYYDKSIGPRVYQVLNNAGLVFDGRLVIDNNCKTNDPYIYSAGTLTKYSRKYYAANFVHKFYNRVEIGLKLGKSIRNKLVPTSVRKYETKKYSWNFQLDLNDRLVTNFHKPVMRYSRLPGGMYYLCISKPGRYIPWERAVSRDTYGQTLITGNCRNLDIQGFFKIQLDEYDRVSDISCLAKFPLDVRNIHSIWGKHERLLNNLKFRFEMSMITDLFTYFQQPWAYVLYLEKFEDLMCDLNSLITSPLGKEENYFLNDLIQLYENIKWKKFEHKEETYIAYQFAKTMYSKLMEEKVRDFIRQNQAFLTMYATPDNTRKILEGFNKSSLFTVRMNKYEESEN